MFYHCYEFYQNSKIFDLEQHLALFFLFQKEVIEVLELYNVVEFQGLELQGGSLILYQDLSCRHTLKKRLKLCLLQTKLVDDIKIKHFLRDMQKGKGLVFKPEITFLPKIKKNNTTQFLDTPLIRILDDVLRQDWFSNESLAREFWKDKKINQFLKKYWRLNDDDKITAWNILINNYNYKLEDTQKIYSIINTIFYNLNLKKIAEQKKFQVLDNDK